jgi:hypothetical protein
MMRLSVDQDDPGYHPAAIRCSVTLDGVTIHDCRTADEEQGYVVCYGKWEPRWRDQMPTEVRYGVVKIIVPEEYATALSTNKGET